MGQREVIQALKNLGGKAFKKEFLEEYIKIVYPPEVYGKDYLKSRTYSINDLPSKYIRKLKEDKIIKVEEVENKDYDIHNLRIGIKKKTVLLRLL